MTDHQQDPWGDMPAWSDDQQAADSAAQPEATSSTIDAAQAGPQDAPETEGGTTPTDTGPATCSWCGTPAADGATRCGSCGAALAQRESIGDLVIPGLTAVDPALKDLDGRPLHLSGPSPSHGVASGVIVAAAAGGPIGLAILGGVGAVAAAEYIGASRDIPGAKGHDNVGETSEAVLQAIERLERGEALPAATDTTPRPELATQPGASSAQSADSKAATEEASDGAS